MVTISVPGGEEAAQRTFNPHLGIEGGISILGTSGIVEPMSVQALVDTMALELRQAALHSDGRLVLVPGNYGLDFLAQHDLIPEGIPVVRCSNFIGETLDQARLEGFREVLLVGHIGKLVKLAGGIMNTHSRWADGRRELFCAHAALAGADRNTARLLWTAPPPTAVWRFWTRQGCGRKFCPPCWRPFRDTWTGASARKGRWAPSCSAINMAFSA